MKTAYLLLGLVLLGHVAAPVRAQDDDPYGDDEGYGGEDPYGGGYGGGDPYGGGGYGGGGYGGGGPSLDDPMDGVLSLDASTYDKVVDGDHHMLLVLYGEDADSAELGVEMMEVSAELAQHKGLLMAKANAEAAPQIAEKFGATTLPAVLYVAKGDMKVTALAEDSPKLAKQITEFITSFAGEVGTVESLKPTVEAFMTGDAAAKKKAAAALAKAVAQLKGYEAEYGAYYTKVVAKMTDKGDAFIKTEFERLQRMIVSGSLRAEKEAEFKLRCAVLRVFSRETLVNLEPVEEEEEAHAEL